MALVLKDRVKETTTTTGTGTVTLAGASTGYQSFSVIGNANTTYYCIAGQGTAEWEVGIGTYTASGTTLSRDTILASSNSGSVVTFSAGTKDVFVVYPAGKSVNLDASNNATALGTVASATLTNATGLPISTGVSGLGTGVATALAVNTGSSGAFVVNGGALGTPSSGTVTNLTGTASININGTVGATTPSTGAFTTLSASGVATFSAGSAAAPAITTSGDTNNGIFFPAADVTAITTAGSERLRIDSSGNVGIGTSSPSTYGKFAVQTQTSNAPTVAITGSGLNPQLNHYINDSTAVLRNLNQIQFVTGSSDISNYQGYMTFSTMGSAGGTISERMRINSNGKILFNTTTQNINEQVGMVYSSNAGVGFSIKDSNAQNGNTFIEFRNGTTLAGNITSNGTTTMTYGSASDYRLKENLVPLTGALAKLGSLRPKVGNWKVDGSEFVGFVAHELQEVFPDAVVGEKDRVDADGNPLHQMVDTGSASIIATLTAALQEAHGLIKDLQTRVATLEAK